MLTTFRSSIPRNFCRSRGVAAIGLFLLLFSSGGCVSSRGCLREARQKPFDAVIVPGIPFNGKKWGSLMRNRVTWSYVLYKNGYARNVIFSGGAVYTPYYESKVMALYAQALGIPAAHIFCDTQAWHSTENVYFSYLLANKKRFRKVALATGSLQALILRHFIRRHFDSPICLIPFNSDSVKKYSAEPDIDAASAKKENWESILKQRTFFQRLRGAFGKRINWDRYKEEKVPALRRK